MDPKKIIILDKDVIGLELFTQLFQEKYQVLKAKTPQTARRLIKKNAPDLLIYCESFKDESAIEILEEIRNTHPQTKRIFLRLGDKKKTASLNPDLAHVWLDKPGDRDELRKIVNSLLTDLYFNADYQKFNRKLTFLQDVIRTRNLKSLFQPIAQFEPLRVLGHELFTYGPRKFGLQKAETLVHMSHRAGLMLEFEEAARANALEVLRNGPHPNQIFLNNCPSVILNPEFEKLLLYEALDLKPKNIVIEINDCHHLDNLKEFIPRLKYYRAKGFKISIDDVGKDEICLYLIMLN